MAVPARFALYPCLDTAPRFGDNPSQRGGRVKREDFLRAIREHPEDDALRLVFADWLEEHGGPSDRDRATFIRLEVERDRLKQTLYEDDPRVEGLDAQAQALWQRHKDEWLGPLAGLLPKEYETRRGFVGWASFSALEFTRKAGAICDLTPLEEVFIGRCDRPGMQALCACPALARVGRVTFYDTAIRSAGLATLAASAYLAGVRALVVEGNDVDPRGARALAQSPHVAGLRELNLSSNRLGDRGARAVAAGNWRELRSLD